MKMEELVDSLRMQGIDAYLVDEELEKPREEVLIVKNYAPSAKDKNRICMALSFLNYPDNFANRIWISAPDGTVSGLNPHSKYCKFDYHEVQYHPYSINLEETEGFRFDLMGVKRVLKIVYNNHILF